MLLNSECLLKPLVPLELSDIGFAPHLGSRKPWPEQHYTGPSKTVVLNAGVGLGRGLGGCGGEAGQPRKHASKNPQEDAGHGTDSCYNVDEPCKYCAK